MLRADHASVGWNPEKKRWEVRIQVGGEVMKRPISPPPGQSGAEPLKAIAAATSKWRAGVAAMLAVRIGGGESSCRRRQWIWHGRGAGDLPLLGFADRLRSGQIRPGLRETGIRRRFRNHLAIAPHRRPGQS